MDIERQQGPENRWAWHAVLINPSCWRRRGDTWQNLSRDVVIGRGEGSRRGEMKTGDTMVQEEIRRRYDRDTRSELEWGPLGWRETSGA